jgi:mannose-6-phosphate isomerase-like protein (cupin superfamily)
MFGNKGHVRSRRKEDGMELAQIDPREGFEVLAGTDRAQAATMTLGPGQSTGGPDNRHPKSDQWLYVVSGEGRAVVEGEESRLREGALLLIEAGEAHEIANDGERPLKTFSVYAPPVY